MATRGRKPRTERQVEADRVISRAAERLIMWGFSTDAVFEALGNAARSVLGRTADGKTALGPDRVKQLWEELRPPGLERYRSPEFQAKVGLRRAPARSMFTKRSLRAGAPPGSLEDLAAMLLRNRGYAEPIPDDAPVRELDLSPSWESALAAGPKRGRKIDER